jgi:hypothetical protein
MRVVAIPIDPTLSGGITWAWALDCQAWRLLLARGSALFTAIGIAHD